MHLKNTRERLLATTIICGAAMAIAAPAFAQDAPVQEVVVTGSRIPQPNLASASPIVSVGSQEVKLEGSIDAVDLLSELPQTSGNLGNTPSPLNGSGGFTTVNLRGLGDVRTLVLIDGKRLMPGDPTTGGEAPDLDQIPTQLIDRVEVVTGGASAVYGSDAIAGVVNFIMKHNFQGVQLDAQYGFAQHDNDDTAMQDREKAAGFPAPSGGVTDGQTWNVSFITGINSPDGKGNVEAYATYAHRDPVTEGSRDYSACLLEPSQVCSGSVTSNLISFVGTPTAGSVNGRLAAAAAADLTGNTAGPNNDFSVVGTSLLSYPQAGSTPPSVFNSSPYEYLSREDQRYTSGYFAHYDFSKELSVYADLNFMDDRTTEVVAPGGIFYGTGTPATGDFQIACNSPLLSTQEVTQLCTNNGLAGSQVADLLIGRRNVEGGGRVTNYEHESFRQDIGARGVLGDVWHYDVSLQYGYTKYTTNELNYFSTNGFQTALNNGTYHLFTQGGVTAADLATVNAYGTAAGSTTEQIASATIGGDLGHYGIKSPWANEGIGVSVGTEYRREALNYLADLDLSSGDLNGSSGASPPVNAAFDVYELFTEIRVPLVQDKPFVKDLNFTYGYRFADYSSAGDVGAIKYAAEYAPTSDIRFRGSFQRAVRAPNINELFTPEEVTQSGTLTVDPCAPTTNAAGQLVAATATLAQCQRSAGAHVTAAQIATLYGNGGTTDNIAQCPAGQCAYAYGGNQDLKPEVSDTTSFGFVVTPTFFRGFDFSVDYYRIEIKGEISSIDPSIILNQCLNNNNLCQFVNRSAQGNLFGDQLTAGGYVVSTQANIGYTRTSGFDISSHYRLNLADFGWDVGRLLFSFNGTYTQHFIISPGTGLGNFDCAGLFGTHCGLEPNWRHQMRVTWSTPWKLELSGQWRYTGGSSLDANTSNPLIEATSFDSFDAKIPAISYFDFSAIWHVRDGYQLRAGVNNVFDKDPPLIAQTIVGTGNPNTFGSYDVLGRTIFVGITADF